MKLAPASCPEIREAFDKQPLFENKTWRLSPWAWPLAPEQVAELERIGEACLEFHRALETLYLRSAENKKILSNKPLRAPWVAEYLDRGKPEALISHARGKRLRGAFPIVIRPDLLLTENGFALTEIDSVPGGIGLTAFLNRLYGHQNVIGGKDGMIDGFYEAIAALAPGKANPFIAILVSDEAATYRPEMRWLAATLQRRGKRAHAFDPGKVMPLGSTLCADVDGNPEKVDIVYRFWELFDLTNLPAAKFILDAWEESALAVTPPMRHFHEEKLLMALFHHHLLEDFWRENLDGKTFRLLRRIIPPAWVMDPVELPPNAVLDAPFVGGRPVSRWEQLAEASQKERNWVIKMSGFHEEAWGARSVMAGCDASRLEWAGGIQRALKRGSSNLYILQDYRKPMRLRHPVYEGPDKVKDMEGRLRLCPYYFIKENRAELRGVLATFCPADKKIIHGMRDAALLPCRVERSKT